MNTDDLVWKIIRACGLSTTNSDINVFKLHKNIKEILSIRELTDEEISMIGEKYLECVDDCYIQIFARAILKKASKK